uniref:G_PROTEIN_RECEP_F1_2 domain-containing protein n=1 Tax=Steinernema glaseri TaxID=37863 RepID=A0A1I7ZDD0_9BILA
MLLDFYSHFLHTVCLSTSAAVFAVVSVFTSYAITCRTPSALKAYKFLFFHLNGSYQMIIFLTGVFGPFDITAHENGMVTFKFCGLLPVLGRIWPFFEGFLALISFLNVILCIWMSFLYRYCQVCHPKSLYSNSPLLQRAANVVVLIVIPAFLAALLIMLVWMHSLDDPQTEALLTVRIYTHAYIILGALLLFFVLVIISGATFNLRVIWVLETSLSLVCEKTRSMQRMLTITLVVQSSISLAFGIIPVGPAIYAIFLDNGAVTVFFRMFFLSFTFQGICHCVTTVLLVKPYKELLISVLKRMKVWNQATTTIAVKKIAQ